METGEKRFDEFEELVLELDMARIIFAEEEEEEEEEEARIVVSVKDITERKRTEEALRESEEIFHQFMKYSPIYVFFKDENIKAIRLSENYAKMLGKPISELLGKDMDDLFPSDLAKGMVADDKRVLKEDKKVEIEEELNGRFYSTIKFPVYREGKPTYLAGFTVDITERRKTQEALREANEKLRVIFDSIGEAVTVVDLDGNVVDANKEALRLHGFSSKEEIIGWKASNLAAGIDRERAVKDAAKAFKEPYLSGRKEYKLIHTSGREFDGEFNVALLRDKAGKPAGFIGVARDISERKKAETALKKSEEKYKNLFELEKDVICSVDALGFVTSINAAVNSWGYKQEEVVGMNFLELIAPEWREVTAVELQKRLLESDEYIGETVGINKDGQLKPMEYSAVVIYEQGKYAGAQAIVRDITERKKAERILQDIIDKNPMSIQIVDKDGFTLKVNPAHTLLFGAVPPSDFSFFNDPQLKQLGFGELIERIKNGEVVHFPDIRYNAHDSVSEAPDVPLWVRVVVFPLNDSNGKPERFIFMHENITERKQAEERRLELERKYLISSRLASIGEMAAGIAHEINNPLSPILGFADLLLKEDLPAAVKADLQIISDCANRAADVTRGLLIFARQSKPMRKLYSINEVVETTIRLRIYHLKTNNIRVIKELDPELPETMVDAAQLQQVLLNLIMNAEYEMNKAHGGGNLTIKTEKKDNIIRVLVKDDGQGISSENMEKLFHPFFTTKNVGEGTGLGLSVCHGIVAEHNGRIYAESEEGNGATFIVELPIVRQEEEAKPSEPDAGEAGEAALARILVVDDEPSVTQVLKRVLTAEGYEVKAVGTAKEALKLIKGGKRYALILLDIKMPDMSGIELYQHLDKTVGSLTQKIIFITGDVLGTDTMDFFSRTGASYITKPFDIEQLKKEIKSKLTQKV